MATIAILANTMLLIKVSHAQNCNTIPSAVYPSLICFPILPPLDFHCYLACVFKSHVWAKSLCLYPFRKLCFTDLFSVGVKTVPSREEAPGIFIRQSHQWEWRNARTHLVCFWALLNKESWGWRSENAFLCERVVSLCLDSAEDVRKVCPLCPLLARLNDTRVVHAVNAALAAFNAQNNGSYFQLVEASRAQIVVRHV